jgi:hypothetical protein
MSAPTANGQSLVERVRRRLSRAGLAAIVATLALGLSLEVFGDADAGLRLLTIAFVLLVTMPVLNVTAVLFEEIQRREWRFVCCAVFVLALIAWRALR